MLNEKLEHLNYKYFFERHSNLILFPLDLNSVCTITKAGYTQNCNIQYMIINKCLEFILSQRIMFIIQTHITINYLPVQ